jgi:hypothetical protein
MKYPLTSGKIYVGSEYAKKIGLGKGFFELPLVKNVFEMTNCALYPAKVISEAMLLFAAQFSDGSEESKRWIEHARKIAQMGQIASFKNPETSTPVYLTKTLRWNAYYWSRDVYHQQKHSWRGQGDRYWAYQYEYSRMKKNRKDDASGIPISGFFVNFAPRPLKYASAEVITTPQPNPSSLAALKKIRFAYGFYRGGYHNWLLHEGYVYHARWAGADGTPRDFPFDGVGGSVHEKMSIEKFWEEKAAGGVIIAPKAAQGAVLANSAAPDFYELMSKFHIPSESQDEVSKAI